MQPDRWEVGSDFQWPGLPRPGDSPAVPWTSGLLLSSGRDALRLALAVGVGRRGWRRLWVPEYFCQHVVAALVRPGLELRVYPDDPLRRVPDLPDACPGDAILVMNYFGLREALEVPRRDGVEIIEDHSHDPTSAWAASSSADFCVASMRKTVPVADGGVLWSPLGHALPAPPRLTPQRRRTAATKLAAMILKTMYLDGHEVEKSAFRVLARRGERGFAVPAVSAMSPVSRAILASFPIDAWRRARIGNHEALRSHIAGVGLGRVPLPAGPDGVPFSCVLVTDTPESRETVRHHLIKGRIYPAVLWPLERPVLAISDEARDLSRRMLSIPCDARYGAEDMQRTGDVLREAGQG